MAAIAHLPPELCLRFLEHCDAVDVFHFGLASRSCCAIALSDDAFRHRCQDLWDEHHAPSNSISSVEHGAREEREYTPAEMFANKEAGSWVAAWQHLFGRYQRYLGWWAMTSSMRGRLLRLYIQVVDITAAPLKRFSIAASTVAGMNKYANEEIDPAIIPQHAIVNGSSYYMPPLAHYSHHPDRDLLVDVLEPYLVYRPVMIIDAEHGAHMPLRGDLSLTARLDRHRHIDVDNLIDAHRSSKGKTGLPSEHLLFAGACRYHGEHDDLLSLSWGMPTTNVAQPSPRTFSGFASGFAAIFQSPPAPSTPPPIQLLQDLGISNDPLAMQNLGYGTAPSMTTYLAIRGPSPEYAFTPSRTSRILPASLTGIWSASYGPHGYEFVFVSWCHDNASGTGTIQAVKLVGDANVPAGEPTWRSARIGREERLPTTTTKELVRLADDVDATMQQRREAGMLHAFGRIAGHGYSHATWTPAEAVFVRSERDGREVVDEIRLRWEALGHVSCFRRILASM